MRIKLTMIFNQKMLVMTVKYLPEPVREGYSFVGWFDDENEIVTNEKIVNITNYYTLYAQWIEIVKTTPKVEIVFGKKDMNEKEIKEIIERYTDVNFIIIKFEDGKSGEIRIIIKFNDVEEAKNFIDNIHLAGNSATDDFKLVGFFVGNIHSFSFYLCPLL